LIELTILDTLSSAAAEAAVKWDVVELDAHQKGFGRLHAVAPMGVRVVISGKFLKTGAILCILRIKY